MTYEPDDKDRARASEILDYLTGTWDEQVEQVARALANTRRKAQIAQLREAADVLHDRADVLERADHPTHPEDDMTHSPSAAGRNGGEGA